MEAARDPGCFFRGSLVLPLGTLPCNKAESSTGPGHRHMVRALEGVFHGSWESKGIHPMPPTHPENWALIRPYKGMMVVNNPLIRPYFLGGWHWGGSGPLDFHEWRFGECERGENRIQKKMTCFSIGFLG